MHRTLFAIICLFYCLGSTATAQTTESSLSGFAGIVLPSGDFGDDNSESDGFASTGLAIGVDYLRPMPDVMEGASIVGTASLNINPVDLPADDDDVDAGYWFNLPVLAGGRYTTEFSPTLQAFGQAQIGLNVARSPSFEQSENGFSAEQKAGTAVSMGLSFGVGAIVNDRFHVSLRYVTAGEPEFETETTFEFDGETETDEDEFEQAISFLQLTVGIGL